MHPRLKTERGFTLIEAMIVVAILGVLSSFAATAYEFYVVQSKNSEVSRMFSTIALAEMKFFVTPRNVNGSVLNPCFLAGVRTPMSPGIGKKNWVDSHGSFKAMDVEVASPVYYSYQVTAVGNDPNIPGFCVDATLQSISIAGSSGQVAMISAIGDVNGDQDLDVLGSISGATYALSGGAPVQTPRDGDDSAPVQVQSCAGSDPARAPGVFNKPCGNFTSMFVMNVGVDRAGNPTKTAMAVSTTMP